MPNVLHTLKNLHAAFFERSAKFAEQCCILKEEHGDGLGTLLDPIAYLLAEYSPIPLSGECHQTNLKGDRDESYS